MKKMKFLSMILTLFFVVSCEQEILVQQDPDPDPDPTGESGSANFTKFVSIGNSLTAGYMAGALFSFGQENSYPAIMAEHFAYVSENDAFDQPLVNSVNGCYNPTSGCTLGRLILFDPDGPTGPASAAPTPAGSPGVPAPFNTNATDHLQALAPFTGNKDNLNNFGVPGIILAQALTPATGGPAPPAPNPAYNPYFARFAKTPSTDGTTGSTILSDALATNPTFVSFWLGNNDVLGYAVGGASNPSILTSVPAFTAQYSAAIDAILAHPNNVKMVVGNVPNVTTIPYFRLVPYNPVVITNQAQIDAINAGYAPYNAGLDAAFDGGFITNEERNKRKVIFTVGQNPVVIIDESLTDLSGLGLPNYREATAQDLLVLPAASFIGSLVGGDPSLINGVTVPLADQWVLIPSEITEITTRINDFNAAIAAKVAANSMRMALADIFTKFNELATSPTGGLVVDGLFIRSSLAPPNGVFSEDGVHPNPRGSAYIAKIFIQAINAKFGSTVPEPNISKYFGTFFPVSPAL
ncbi:MAG: hypothetical protein L6Q51_07365 [Cyclobacteriaceae bacterium]|nr:hypothetical protein [Cyclobacteriaceae bacterium]